jgi:hypothetical protein
MHSNRLFLALAALALAACNGGQPRIYKMAIDMSPMLALDQSCYTDNMVPSGTVETTNLRIAEQWVIWDGVGPDNAPQQYLDCGEQKGTLGNAGAYDFNSIIETTQPGTFVGTVRASQPSSTFTSVSSQTLQVAFADEGAAPTGSMTWHTEYGCTNGGCPDSSTPGQSCSVTFQFTARRIDASRVDGYTDVGSSGAAGNGSSSSFSSNSPLPSGG